MEAHVTDALFLSRGSHVAFCVDITLTLLDLASIHFLTFGLAVTSVTRQAPARVLVAF
jgi:hypothetical protein